MKGLVILGCVLLCLVLLMQMRVGVQGEYGKAGPRAWARLGPVRLRLWPRSRKRQPGKREAKPTKPPKEKEKPEEISKGGALDYARELLPLALDAAGQFRKKLRVDRLELVLRAGATDPADAAMVYGCANAALGALWCPLNEAFQIKDGRARVELDFDSQMTTVSAMGAMSLKIGQALWLGLYFGLKGLKKVIAVKGRRGTKDKERKAV